jgi:hypothetical protein
VNEDDPFELFIASTNIRYAYYHETHKILGTVLIFLKINLFCFGSSEQTGFRILCQVRIRFRVRFQIVGATEEHGFVRKNLDFWTWLFYSDTN